MTMTIVSSSRYFFNPSHLFLSSSLSCFFIFVVIISLLPDAVSSTQITTSTSININLNNLFSLLTQTNGGVDTIKKTLQTKWNEAYKLAKLEQSVEDYNADIIATSTDHVSSLIQRRLIVLPLDERLFNPPPGMFSHNHVQTGDKMSLPKNFWVAIQKSGAEVPWLFEVSRIEGVTGERALFVSKKKARSDEEVDVVVDEDANLNKVVGGAIDFRSPSNYIFLPRWMMIALALKPRDIVNVRMITDVSPGSLIKLRPHNSKFLKITNHQAVLETELKHYSSLTKGSTIPFDYMGKRYYFDVVDLKSSPRGEKSSMVKVQDCDIATDFLRPKDQLKKLKKKKKTRNESEIQ